MHLNAFYVITLSNLADAKLLICLNITIYNWKCLLCIQMLRVVKRDFLSVYMQATTEVPKIKPQLGIHVMNIIKGSKNVCYVYVWVLGRRYFSPKYCTKKKKKRL